MQTSDYVHWLKSRYKQTAKKKYLKTRKEREEDREIHDVFTKIDYDCSGQIDVSELRNMFSQNGIELSRSEIEAFFNLCKTESKGYLNY